VGVFVYKGGKMEIEEYFKKAEIITDYFGIYGIGNFDLSIEEIAIIIKFIIEKKDNQHLEINIKEMYERLSKLRLG
jgi:hypothetical protein